MNIEELKSKYPSAQFYRLKSSPHNLGYLQFEDIDDFISIAKIVGYIEVEPDELEDAEARYETCVQVLVNSVMYDGIVPGYEVRAIFDDEEKTAELRQMCHITSSRKILELYGIDTKIKYIHENYTDEFDPVPIILEMQKLYAEYCEQALADRAKAEKEIYQIIDSYIDEYCKLATKSEREKLIRKIQMKLKNTFGLSGRGDSVLNANRLAIEFYMEEKCDEKGNAPYQKGGD